MKNLIVHIRRNLLPVRNRLCSTRMAGIPARHSGFGCTGTPVGHHIFIITSEGRSFAFLGDLTHHPNPVDGKAADAHLFRHRSRASGGEPVEVLTMLAAQGSQ